MTRHSGFGATIGSIATPVHCYLARRVQTSDPESQSLLERGRTNLILEVAFVSACIALVTVSSLGEAGSRAALEPKSLAVAGWVAMWRPMPICLYDRRPLQPRERLYKKLSHVPVEVLQSNRRAEDAPLFLKDVLDV